MEAGPSSHSSSSTSSQVTRTLTTYYPLTSETACSQGSQSDDNATRAQQDDLARKLLGRVVSPQQGDKIWRNVVVWEGGAGKGKGRTVVKDEQWQQEAKKAKDQGRAVSSTPAAAHNRFHPSSTSSLRLPPSPTFNAFVPRLPPPPPRGDLSWIPDVPILEWGELPTVEEELMDQEGEESTWWLENEGRLHASTTDSDCPLKTKKELKRKNKKILEKERIRKERESWKGDWTMMGECVDLIPHPHFSPFLFPHSSLASLPPLASITAPPHPFISLPLPSHPPFPPLTPGLQRGRWIIPINGPVLGFPSTSSHPPLSSGRLVNDEARIRKAEETLRKRMKHSIQIASNDTEKPATLYWTPTLLRSFHRTLLRLQSRNVLGPISFKVKRSNIDIFNTSSLTCSSGAKESSRKEMIQIGDHWVVGVDLAYALRIRHVLGRADVRMVEESEKQEDRPMILTRARLMLLDDVGNVLCFS